MKLSKLTLITFIFLALSFSNSNLKANQQIGLIIIDSITPRIITPNGDGINDRVIFSLGNAEGIPVTGEIFDIYGAKVADLEPDNSSAPDNLYWDGKRGGGAVPSGIYLYQLRAKGQSINGTIVVAK